MDNVEVIFEDDFLLAINKPVGLVVNRSQTSQSNTLQDYLVQNVDFDDTDFGEDGEEFNSRSGIVHRLDKNTSGLLLIAKDNTTFKALQAQFKGREVVKKYDALVYGIVKDPEFEVNAPLGRNPRNRFKYAIVDGGKEAITRFININSRDFGTYSVTHLKCLPKTGRTHQIRVHLLAVNHPIVGDDTYATKRQLDDSRGDFARMMLHAASLEFTHPSTGVRLCLVAPLPDGFVLPTTDEKNCPQEKE